MDFRLPRMLVFLVCGHREQLSGYTDADFSNRRASRIAFDDHVRYFYD
ncbi:hypothetical protein ACT8ZR_20835 [Neobacillus sp. M.A.Huq-85]